LEIVSMHTASKVIALDKVTKEMNLEKRGWGLSLHEFEASLGHRKRTEELEKGNVWNSFEELNSKKEQRNESNDAEANMIRDYMRGSSFMEK
jgi:hypothetical protein